MLDRKKIPHPASVCRTHTSCWQYLLWDGFCCHSSAFGPGNTSQRCPLFRGHWRGREATTLPFLTHSWKDPLVSSKPCVIWPVLFSWVTAMKHNLRTVQRIPSWVHCGALWYLLTTSLIPDKICILALWARSWIPTIHLKGSLWPYSSFNPNFVVFCCIPTEIPPLCKVLEADKRVVQLGSISYNYLQTFFAMSLLPHGSVAHLWLLLVGGLPWHSCPPGLTSHPRDTSDPPSTASLVPAALYTTTAMAGGWTKPPWLHPLPWAHTVQVRFRSWQQFSSTVIFL